MTMAEIQMPPAEGFNILEVVMRNFNKYGSKLTIIHFESQFTAILGPTGSGKSSILDALTFAIYRRTTRTDEGMKIIDIVHDGGFARVKFSLNGKIYEIERGVRGKKNSSYVVLKIDGEKFKGTIPVIDARIREIIGLDYDGFCCSSFIRQDEIKYFSNIRASERLEKLQGLFRLNIFNKAQDRVKLKKVKKEDEKLRIESSISVLREEVKKIPGLKRDYKDRKIDLEHTSSDLSKLKSRGSKLEKALQDLTPLYLEYEQLTSTIEKIKEECEEIEEKIGELEEEQVQYKQNQTILSQVEAEFNKLESAKTEYERLQIKSKEIENLTQQRELITRQIQSKELKMENDAKRIQIKINDTSSKIKKADTDIDKDEAFTILTSDGRFSERLSRIKNIELDLAKRLEDSELLSNFTAELKGTEHELTSIQSKKPHITGDSFLLSEFKDQIKERELEMERLQKDLQKDLADLQKQSADFDEKMKKINFTGKEKEQKAQLEEKIHPYEKIKKEMEDLKKKTSQAVDNTSLISHLKQRYQKRQKKLAEDKENFVKLSPKIIEYRDLFRQQKELQDSIQQTSNEKSSITTELKMIKERITELKNTEGDIAQSAAHLEELEKEISILQVLYDKVFHKKGIALFAINKMLPHISKKASNILSEITEKRFTNLRLEEVQSGRQYGFDIKVEDRGELRDATSYSGGEKTQINAAIRLAISEQLSEIPDVSQGRKVVIHTLFIDEGDIGSLDPDQSRPIFIRKIFNLRDTFKKIILITQFPEVATAPEFEKVIHIEQSPFGESQVVKKGKTSFET